jgi:hypothetical protein
MTLLMLLKEASYITKQPALKLIMLLKLLDTELKMVSSTGLLEIVGEHIGLTKEMLKYKEELTA